MKSAEFFVPEYKSCKMLTWRHGNNFNSLDDATKQIDVWKMCDKERIEADFISDSFFYSQ